MKTLKLLDFVETPAFALVFPPDGAPCIGFWNTRAEEVTGLSRDDVIGQVPTNVMGTLAEPLLSRSWIKETGEVRVDGLGVINLVALPDNQTVIATVMTAAQEAADRDREMFLGLAIHDARAPLRNISYLCEELLVDFDDVGDGRNALVRKVRSIADRTLRMSDEVLTSVQAASLQTAGTSQVNLQSICDLIFATLDPMGKHRLIGMSLLLEVERPLLQTVLRNLIDNAISHGGKDCSVSIDVRATSAADGTLHLCITDNGTGFSDAALAYLDGGDVRRGSGFGLYGVRRLVETRGGRIQVARSPANSGSVVTVTLPGQVLEVARDVARAS